MPEKDEKEIRAKVGGTEFERETSERSSDPSADRDRDRYRDRGYDDDYDYRTRRGTQGIGEGVRDTARSVRRGGTDIISASCDLIGGIFIGIGEAISPGRRGGDSSGCVSCATPGRRYDEDDYSDRDSGSGSQRVSRTEVRRSSSTV